MDGAGLTAVAAVGIALCLPGPVFGQTTDPSIGRHLAETVCIECHQVDSTAVAPSANPKAPRFVDIARMPSTTELAIKVFLRSPHATMPNILLSHAEVDSIAAYILEMKPR